MDLTQEINLLKERYDYNVRNFKGMNHFIQNGFLSLSEMNTVFENQKILSKIGELRLIEKCIIIHKNIEKVEKTPYWNDCNYYFYLISEDIDEIDGTDNYIDFLLNHANGSHKMIFECYYGEVDNTSINVISEELPYKTDLKGDRYDFNDIRRLNLLNQHLSVITNSLK